MSSHTARSGHCRLPQPPNATAEQLRPGPLCLPTAVAGDTTTWTASTYGPSKHNVLWFRSAVNSADIVHFYQTYLCYWHVD